MPVVKRPQPTLACLAVCRPLSPAGHLIVDPTAAGWQGTECTVPASGACRLGDFDDAGLWLVNTQQSYP